MNKRIIFLALLAMALFLVPGTSHARWLNPNTGRFQTMDAYQGDNEDPLSLHKYLYVADNPVNKFDPSGRSGEVVGVVNIGTLYFGSYLASYDFSGVQVHGLAHLTPEINTLRALSFIRSSITSRNGASIAKLALTSLENLASVNVASLSECCGPAAAAFAHAWEGSIMTARTLSDIQGGGLNALNAMQSHFSKSLFKEVGLDGAEAQVTIEQLLLQAGNGSQGIVGGFNNNQNAQSTMIGHFFNAVNDDGVVKFIDMSQGGLPDAEDTFDRLKNFYFLLIKY